MTRLLGGEDDSSAEMNQSWGTRASRFGIMPFGSAALILRNAREAQDGDHIPMSSLHGSNLGPVSLAAGLPVADP
jgi:hypothetical protein